MISERNLTAASSSFLIGMFTNHSRSSCHYPENERWSIRQEESRIMGRSNAFRLALLASFIPILALTGCGGSNGTGSTGEVSLKGQGATFPQPIYEKWFSDFAKSRGNVRVFYQGNGSGAGIKAFQSETVEFAGSDAAMTDEELAAVPAGRGAVMIPLTAGSIVVSYNLPDVPVLKLSREAYSGIFLGTITKWNDSKIAATNTGVALPDLPINVVSRADSSGTTFVFTNHLAAASPAWKVAKGATGKKKVDFPGVSVSGNDGIAAHIKSNPGCVGYLEYGFASSQGLAMAVLENKSGAYIAATPESGKASLATAQLAADLRGWIPDPDGKDCYPIVGMTWLLCYKTYSNPAAGAAIRDVLDHCLTKGQDDAVSLGYIPLPANIVEKAQAAVKTVGGS
jgi:phosphate transport system substrate-binding protein